MKRLVYIIGTSLVMTVLVMGVALSLKQAACDSVEGIVSAGPCVSDGNGFASLALGVFIAALLLVTLNLWIIKRFKP